MAETTECGVTAFAPPPAPTYRFFITSKAEKVKITLEGLESKKQWSSGFLDDKEYLTSTNKVPNASPTDYVKVFKDALEFLMKNSADEDEDEIIETDKLEREDDDAKAPLNPAKIRRKLTPLKDDTFQLELTVKIRIFESAWNAKYLFSLEPVTLDRLDILEAKLRDVEEELEKTTNNLSEEKQERANVAEELSEVKAKLEKVESALISVKNSKAVVRLNAASKNVPQLNDKGQLKWSSVTGSGFVSSIDGYGVRVLVAGWYVVHSTVYLAPQTVGTDIKIQVNGTYLRSMPAPCTLKQNTSVTFAFTTYFKQSDEIVIVATGSPFKVGGDLDAFRLGN
ncbi:uncharacterized protein PITG_04315 [Phytophthora infestans T30-4]|uniref:Uncharacterized protein n=2 Tax=Phytophthora infestans TaxID=4787 RepID=D0N0Z9_PHYIT|nr:uncharacterized protein PITG_04315 [Phytophthora infestans T30-4]EEY67312.1 conserved hypothetical protein [Phytophthora infestans T30-4]KAF4045618.1 hypothetical protein GN244_ATG02069 [Phytophthora infestans]KAF4140044.1 hypothetical protein GN958_ATG10794 [Phytophthora infestans]KAI9985170.1 hypothetical protein PInf_004495 [Phytophthora infestans]|eukprot:XP_002905960.1 conserved hypothetical protein [Phytophthora infestans T30-4]